MDFIRPSKDFLVKLSRDWAGTCLTLFRVMIPVIIIVKALKELNLIRYLTFFLDPVMELIGLPGEMGIVWATAMVDTIYGSIIVLLSLNGGTMLTTAQVTILATVVLVAHSLPVELKIAQKSGPKLPFQAICRLGCAFFIGWFLNRFYSYFDLLQNPSVNLLKREIASISEKESTLEWALGQARTLIYISIVIFALLGFMRILQKIKVIDMVNRLLRPILRIIGIGPKASTITIFGLSLGITYGGGLIIHEARNGHVKKEDVFFSLTLMGISHSLIEDTLLMVMIGGDLSGILWARLIFSLVFVSILVRTAARLPRSFCERYFWGDPR